MYKIKINDLDLAKSRGVLIRHKDEIWADVEHGMYIDKQNATVFKTFEEAETHLQDWEQIVNIEV